MVRSLDRLIRPKSIAVFGGKEARRVIYQCDKMGFSGDIWPVHPREDEILGRKCYRSVADLPGAPRRRRGVDPRRPRLTAARRA